MLLEISGNGKLASVQRCVSKSVDALVGLDAKGDEVAIGRTDDETRGFNLHTLSITRMMFFSTPAAV
jgi:hypothetical protein